MQIHFLNFGKKHWYESEFYSDMNRIWIGIAFLEVKAEKSQMVTEN